MWSPPFVRRTAPPCSRNMGATCLRLDKGNVVGALSRYRGGRLAITQKPSRTCGGWLSPKRNHEWPLPATPHPPQGFGKQCAAVTEVVAACAEGEVEVVACV